MRRHRGALHRRISTGRRGLALCWRGNDGSKCGIISIVGQWEELIETARRSPAKVRFRDLCGLLVRLGYVVDCRRGSHRIYRHSSRRDLPPVNLQEGGAGKAKPYQVRQVLGIVETYSLEVS